MRLGQLARKLSRRQNEIVTFLSQHDIQIDDGSNTRLEDEHVFLIMKQYALTQEEDMIETLALEKDKPEEPLIMEKEPVPSEPELEEIRDLRTEIPEVIRVQKIELSGLKVLGKIDLSQPKKEEPSEPLAEPLPTIPVPELKPRKNEGKVFQQRKDRIDQKKKNNPIALQREHESKEAIERRRKEEEREKEKRKQHYHNKVKAVRPSKMVRPVKIEKADSRITDVPKTWMGRFWKWLRP